MKAKKVSGNEVELPNAIADAYQDADSFDVTEENGKIILSPVDEGDAAIYGEAQGMGFSQSDMDQAIQEINEADLFDSTIV